MLTEGFNHVAVLTNDTARFVEFYESVFDARVIGNQANGDFRLTFVQIGTNVDINLFEITGNDEATRQTPMFGRGRLDHLALQARSIDDFGTIRERLIERGASDGFVTDFGPVLSIFFRDPDGLEAEVCVPNPDAVPGVFNPPGTPAARYV